MSQKGIIHLLPLLLALVVVVVGIYLVIQLDLTSLFKKQPKVELETSYSNPLNKETQYVNPFDTYKNPFVVGR